jgi:dihydrofolate reductase
MSAAPSPSGVLVHLGGTTLVGEERAGRRDAVETVKDMKRRDSRPLRTIGSLSLCRSLLQAGEVDRFRVVVFPVITGAATGKERIFDGYPDIALDLIESRTFNDRLQLLEYVPTVLDGPPGVGDSPEPT